VARCVRALEALLIYSDQQSAVRDDNGGARFTDGSEFGRRTWITRTRPLKKHTWIT
jgi:hypothetical protein